MGNCSCGCTSSTISGGVTSAAYLKGRIYAPTYVSAYSIAVQNGFVGTVEEWLDSLKGKAGVDGKSAYELAVESGYEGTLEEWLKSLQGEDGESAYQIAVNHGYEGTEAEWIAEVSANQQVLSQLENKLDVVSQTLDKYASRIEPIFEAEQIAEAESGIPVFYKICVAEKEETDTLGVSVSQKLSAQEITDICV